MPRSSSNNQLLAAERLSYSLQLTSVTLCIPPSIAESHSGSPCSLYIKWSRGKQYRAKLEPIPLPSSAFLPQRGGGVPSASSSAVYHESNSRRRRSSVRNALPTTLTVPLPATHHATFDLRVSGPSARKLWEVECVLLRYSDHRRLQVKERTVVARLQEDVCVWLQRYRVRVGQMQTVLLPIVEKKSTLFQSREGEGDASQSLSVKLLVTPTAVLVGAAVRESSQARRGDNEDPDEDEDSKATIAMRSPQMAIDENAAKKRFPVVPLPSVSSSSPLGSSTSPLLKIGAAFRSLLTSHLPPPPSSSNGTAAVANPIHHGAFSPLETMIEEGMFKAVRIPRTEGTVARCIETAFEALFGSSSNRNSGTPPDSAVAASYFGSVLHRGRDDAEYKETPFEWTTATGGAVLGTRTTLYRLRIAKEKYEPAVEHTALCATSDPATGACDGLAVHISTFAPQAPIVGDKVRLEVFLHLFYEGGASGSSEGGSEASSSSGTLVVAIHLFPCILSGKIKFMFGSKINHQAEKLLGQVERAVRGCLVVTHHGGGRGLGVAFRRSARFAGAGGGVGASAGGGLRQSTTHQRFSLRGSLATGSSLDPNLWRRLTDEATLPNADHVQHLLARLVPTVQSKRPVTSHIVTLETILGYHRNHSDIVASCCRLLLLMWKQCSAAWIAAASPTMAATVTSVTSLHFGRPDVRTDALGVLLRQLQEESEKIMQAKTKEALEDRNYWLTLDRYAADAEVVMAALETVRIGARTKASNGKGAAKSALDLLHPAAALQQQTLHSSSWNIVALVPTAEAHARVLCRVLSLHLQLPAVCQGVLLLFQCVLETRSSVFRQWLRAIPPLNVAIRAALTQWDASEDRTKGSSGDSTFLKLRAALAAATDDGDSNHVDGVDGREGNNNNDESAFRLRYGSIVPADDTIVYSGYVMVREPWLGLSTLYLTSSGYFCLGSHVLILSKSVRRLERCRRFLQAGMKFVMIATMDDYVVTTFGSRDRLVEALKGLGFQSLLTDES